MNSSCFCKEIELKKGSNARRMCLNAKLAFYDSFFLPTILKNSVLILLFIGFWTVFYNLLQNRVLMITIFAGMFMTSALINFDMFQSYFYQSRFYVSSSTDQSGFNDNSLTQITANILKQPFIAINMLVSGLILAKFMPSAKKLAMWNTAVLVLVILFFIPHAFLSCSDNIKAEYGRYLNYYCNSRCNCDDEATFSPVCTQIGQQTYFSPCHAGCSSIELLNGIKVIIATLFCHTSCYTS